MEEEEKNSNTEFLFKKKVTSNIFRMTDLDDFCFENDFSLGVFNLED